MHFSKLMRRLDRQISEVEAYEILHKGEYGFLAICTSYNGGYGIPLNYAFINNEIYFHCASEGSKLNFIRNNNRVSFCVVGHTELLPSKFSTRYESVIVFGTITEVNDEEKRKGLMYLVEKYSGKYIPEGIETINHNFNAVTVLKLSITSLTGKSRK